MLICPQCSAQNKSHAMFCKGCGASLSGVVEGAPRPPARRVCAKCGASPADDESLCASCLGGDVAVQFRPSAITSATPQPEQNSTERMAAVPYCAEGNRSPICDAISPPVDGALGRCPYCGGRVRKDDPFCGSCGRSCAEPVSPGTELRKQESCSEATSGPAAVSGILAPPTVEHDPRPIGTAPIGAVPKDRLNPQLLAAVGLLVLAVIGGAFYWMRYSPAKQTESARFAQVDSPPASAPVAPTTSQIPNSPAQTLSPNELAPAGNANSIALPSRNIEKSSPVPQATSRPSIAPTPAVSGAPSSPAVVSSPPPVPGAVAAQRVAEPAPVAQELAAPKVEILRPEPSSPQIPLPPSKSLYSGPSSGMLVWRGKLDKSSLLAIEGPIPSVGSLQGELPGVPVMIEVDAHNLGLAEAPGPRNGWKKLVLRSNGKHSAIAIRWTVMK
jgi:hypothetical protein